MPTVQSKFAVNVSLIDDFMMNAIYSMFVKSWTLFKHLCIDNKALKEIMSVKGLKPWRVKGYPLWRYREEYGSSKCDHDLSSEERKKQWLQYLDFWYQHCLRNEYFYVDQVEC